MQSLHFVPGHQDKFWNKAKLFQPPADAVVLDLEDSVPVSEKEVASLVERFDRRGTEPFELSRSEFGQNSVRIKEIFGRKSEVRVYFARIYSKFRKFQHFLEYSA